MKILSALKQLVSGEPLREHHPVRTEALIVEDNPDEMAYLSGLLRFQKALVTQAFSIVGALEAIAKPTDYQIAFIDLNLKDGSGIEVIRRIKESKRMTHAVVVSGDWEKLPLILSYGYIALLPKPYTMDSVREILEKHRLPCAY